jgi:hypothetical protein
MLPKANYSKWKVLGRKEGVLFVAESKTDERKAAFTIVSRLGNSNRGHWPLGLEIKCGAARKLFPA